MSGISLNQAELIAQAQELMAQIDADKLADVLSDGASLLTPEAQKQVGQKLASGASKEQKAETARKALAASIKGWEDERTAIMAMTDGERAVYVPKHVKKWTHVKASTQFKNGKLESVPESWDFGNKPGSVNRSGGQLDKRPVLAERYIFPNSKKGALSLAGTEYRFATQVCRALKIEFNRDSAARVLAQAALDAKKGDKVLSVEYTPTDGAAMSLLERAKAAKKAGLLDARPENK